MTPPHFQIGQEVENIGPDKIGCKFGPERFIISMLWKDDQMYYSAEHQPWYPASSLRLVEDLQVGDWVKRGDLVFQIADTHTGRRETLCLNDDNRTWYSSTSLRKLTPEEIAMHTGITHEWRVDFYPSDSKEERQEKRIQVLEHTMWDVRGRLSAIESRLDALGPSHAELLSDVEAIAERIAADEKRLAILEGERPEVCEGKSTDEPCHRHPERTCALRNVVNRMDCAICEEVAQKMLDNMKEAV